MEELKPYTETSEEEYITLTDAYETWFFADYVDTISAAYPAVQATAALDQQSNRYGETSTAMVVNEGERWFLVTMITICLVIGLIVNSFMIGMIRAHARLHKPEYTVLSLCAMINMGIQISYHTMAIPRLMFYDTLEGYPELLCRVLSSSGSSFFFMSLYSTSILSIIRFLQFCHPLFYMAHVTDHVVYLVFGLVFMVSLLYTAVTEFMIGRSSNVFALTCTLPQKWPNHLPQFILFILIPLAIIIWCTTQIQKTIITKDKERESKAHRQAVETKQRDGATINLKKLQKTIEEPPIARTYGNENAGCVVLQSDNRSPGQSVDDIGEQLDDSDELNPNGAPSRKNISRNKRQSAPSAMNFSYSKKKAAVKTVKLIVFLSGTFIVVQLIPAIAIPVMSFFVNQLDSRMVGQMYLSDLVKRYVAMTLIAVYPCIHPIILIYLDKNYTFFKKHALFRHNRVGG